MARRRTRSRVRRNARSPAGAAVVERLGARERHAARAESARREHGAAFPKRRRRPSVSSLADRVIGIFGVLHAAAAAALGPGAARKATRAAALFVLRRVARARARVALRQAAVGIASRRTIVEARAETARRRARARAAAATAGARSAAGAAAAAAARRAARSRRAGSRAGAAASARTAAASEERRDDE